MKLKSLYFQRTYDDILQGSITFSDKTGEISMVLDEEMSTKVLSICAEQMVESSKKLAAEMTASIFTQPQLEGSKAE